MSYKKNESYKVITFESEAFKTISERIEVIERYVKRTAELFTNLDETLELTSREIMDTFGVSKMTLYRWRNDGSIPYRLDDRGRAFYSYRDVFLAIKNDTLNIQSSNKAVSLAKLAAFKDKIIKSSLWYQGEDNDDEI